MDDIKDHQGNSTLFIKAVLLFLRADLLNKHTHLDFN